ncbi:MAG: transcriptional repressor NrdR [Ruminococcus sp.]|nr:transcriptional repressor NrdR [Ruminococcus sp.]
MKCPFCGYEDSKVTDSRPADEKIRRRRECMKCRGRFTTYEMVELPLLMVEKRDGTYETFDRNKLIKGVFSAIKKRPVTIDQVSEIADYVENYFANELRTIAGSKEIGDLVLNRLREIDPIAYVRFASVYEDFTDIDSFVAAISEFEDISEAGASDKINTITEENKNGSDT